MMRPKATYLPPHVVSMPIVLVEELLAESYLEQARRWAVASKRYTHADPSPAPPETKPGQQAT